MGDGDGNGIESGRGRGNAERGHRGESVCENL